MDCEKSKSYKKNLSNFLFENINLEDIVFEEEEFLKIKTEPKLSVDDLEYIGVFDPNIYKK